MHKAIMISGLLALASPALGAETPAGDVQKGLQLAQEHCSRCHAIEKGGAFKFRPPSFQSIAVYRTPDDIWARVLSPNPHSNMPDTQWTLTPEQIQDVVAYIVSLDSGISLTPP